MAPSIFPFWCNHQSAPSSKISHLPKLKLCARYTLTPPPTWPLVPRSYFVYEFDPLATLYEESHHVFL